MKIRIKGSGIPTIYNIICHTRVCVCVPVHMWIEVFVLSLISKYIHNLSDIEKPKVLS